MLKANSVSGPPHSLRLMGWPAETSKICRLPLADSESAAWDCETRGWRFYFTGRDLGWRRDHVGIAQRLDQRIAGALGFESCLLLSSGGERVHQLALVHLADDRLIGLTGADPKGNFAKIDGCCRNGHGSSQNKESL